MRRNSPAPDPGGQIHRAPHLLHFPGIHFLPNRLIPLPVKTDRCRIPSSPVLGNPASELEIHINRKEVGRIFFDPAVIAAAQNLLEKNIELGLDLLPPGLLLAVFQRPEQALD